MSKNTVRTLATVVITAVWTAILMVCIANYSSGVSSTGKPLDLSKIDLDSFERRVNYEKDPR